MSHPSSREVASVLSGYLRLARELEGGDGRFQSLPYWLAASLRAPS